MLEELEAKQHRWNTMESCLYVDSVRELDEDRNRGRTLNLYDKDRIDNVRELINLDKLFEIIQAKLKQLQSQQEQNTLKNRLQRINPMIRVK